VRKKHAELSGRPSSRKGLPMKAKTLISPGYNGDLKIRSISRQQRLAMLTTDLFTGKEKLWTPTP
jgi:hypothetical protein